MAGSLKRSASSLVIFFKCSLPLCIDLVPRVFDNHRSLSLLEAPFPREIRAALFFEGAFPPEPFEVAVCFGFANSVLHEFICESTRHNFVTGVCYAAFRMPGQGDDQRYRR